MRGRLVDAAEDLVRRDGINALRLEQVAEAVGLHRSSVYRYVASKEDLLTAVVTQASMRVRTTVLRELGPSAPPTVLLTEGLALALAELTTDPIYRALTDPRASTVMSKAGTAALVAGLRPIVDPIFEQAAASGLLRPGVAPEDAAWWLTVVARGLLYSPAPDADRDRLVALLEQMLLPVLFAR